MSAEAEAEFGGTAGSHPNDMLAWAEGTRGSLAEDLALTGPSASSRTMRQRKVRQVGCTQDTSTWRVEPPCLPTTSSV